MEQRPLGISTKQMLLKQMYAVYDDFVSSLDLACRRSCADCCTCNVTMTTLEGQIITDFLASQGKLKRFGEAGRTLPPGRLIPQITFNQIAEYTLQNKELPEETLDLRADACPFLADAECPIYAVRPFGCRCLVSTKCCQETGYAEIGEFVFTVNTVFLQYIEHLDTPGCSGNFSDVLLILEKKENRRLYQQGRLDCGRETMIANHPLKTLMIPPEYRTRIAPILRHIPQVNLGAY